MVFDADKFLKVAVGIGILMAGLGVGYHFGIHLPQTERMKVERADRLSRERQEFAAAKELERKERYDSCLQEAEASYHASWASDCKINGGNNKSARCSLPSDNADRWEKIHEAEQKKCLDEFRLGV
jgi:hypothetical protein